MTAPLPPEGPEPEQLQIEQAAAQATADHLRGQLSFATRRIVAAYILYAGSLSDPIPDRFRQAFASTASRIIQAVAADIRLPLWELVWRSLVAGQRTAFSYLSDAAAQTTRLYGSAAYHDAIAGVLSAVQEYGRPAVATAQWAGDVVHATQTRLEASLLSARAAPHTTLPQRITFNDVMAMLAPLHQAANNLERDVRWATNAAFNQASREVADRHGIARMWVAERDACLHCLALSGQIARAGQPYDASLTYYVGPQGSLKPLPVYPAGPLWGPPRHPNCRCYQIPVPILSDYPVMPWESQPYHPAQALQREARRSVLRGDSGSDSMAARLRATSALLAVGAGLPRSVEARARAAVRARRYPDRRWDRVPA